VINEGEGAFCFAETGCSVEAHEWKRITRTPVTELMRSQVRSIPRIPTHASVSRVH
jgi:hypothetical protein